MIRLLFEIGHLYHRAAIDPLSQAFRQDPRYDIAFVCPNDAERRFGLFNRSLRRDLEARFRAEGLTIADDTRGFDVVIVGDTVHDPKRYGPTLLCFVNHGTGIKNILYRSLRRQPHTRYQIFVEGDYRVDKIRQANALGHRRCTRSACRSSTRCSGRISRRAAMFCAAWVSILLSRPCCSRPPTSRVASISSASASCPKHGGIT